MGLKMLKKRIRELIENEGFDSLEFVTQVTSIRTELNKLDRQLYEKAKVVETIFHAVRSRYDEQSFKQQRKYPLLGLKITKRSPVGVALGWTCSTLINNGQYLLADSVIRKGLGDTYAKSKALSKNSQAFEKALFTELEPVCAQLRKKSKKIGEVSRILHYFGK